MAAEFEAEIRNSLRDIQSSAVALSKVVQGLSGDMKKFGEAARSAFSDEGPKRIRESREQSESLGRSMQELGHAVKGVGGPIGEMIHRLTGGAGLAGGLGAVAVAAGAVNLAMEAFEEAVDRATERAKAAAEANHNLAESIEKAEDAAKHGAAEGLGGAGALRKLRAVGGDEAADAADAVAKSGDIPYEQAAAGVAAAYGRFHGGARTTAAIGSAQRLAQTGIPFGEAVNLLLAHGGDLANPDSARRVESTVYNRYTGSRTNDAREYDLALGDTRPGADGLLDAARGVGFQRNRTRLTNEASARERAETDARGEAAAAANPLTAAILRLNQIAEQQLQVQRDTVAGLKGNINEDYRRGDVVDLFIHKFALYGWNGQGGARGVLRKAEESTYGSLPGAPFGPGG